MSHGRKQPGLEADPAVASWLFELVICRIVTHGKTGGGDHGPHPIATHEWVNRPEFSRQPEWTLLTGSVVP